MKDPYKRLWAAVLEQAILDAQGNVKANKVQHNHLVRESARIWLRNDNEDIGTYRWVCGMLGLDPGFVRILMRIDDNRFCSSRLQ